MEFEGIADTLNTLENKMNQKPLIQQDSDSE